MNIHLLTNESAFKNIHLHQDKWIVADADCGGIPLFACPVISLLGSIDDLRQLVADLESLSWKGDLAKSNQPSIDAAIVITDELNPYTGFPIAINETNGNVSAGIWIAAEFWNKNCFSKERISIQVQEVIGGKLKRIQCG